MSNYLDQKTWYAVQLSPGAAKPARQCKYVFTDDKKKKRKLVCSVLNESVIERSCRIAGIDLYMPVDRQFKIHHRTKRPIDKRTPLIPSHAFVSGVKSFYDLIEAEGILQVVSIGLEPFPISEREIDELRKAEADIDEIYQRDKSRYERSKMKLTRDDVEKMHPVGSVRTVSGGPFDGLVGEVEALKGGINARMRVRMMIEKLGLIELPVDQLDVFCQKAA